MFGFRIQGDKLTVAQQDRSPSIYLDHWAIRRISESPELSMTFRDGLKGRGGTLILSFVNVVEFSRLKSQPQVFAAEALVDSILPHIFFQEADPFLVIERENSLIAGAPRSAPHADMELATGLAKLCQDGPVTFRTCLDAARDLNVDAAFASLQTTLVDRLETIRKSLQVDPEFRRVVGRPPRRDFPQRATRLVLREIVRAFVSDYGTRITTNHATDFLHTVVPVSYSDVVLLDKHWGTLVDRMKHRIEEHEIAAPLAIVYSGERGLHAFLDNLPKVGSFKTPHPVSN